jgi:predicted nucleic acid-binding protein
VITPDRTRIEAVLAHIDETHERNRSAEIVRPDPYGAFPGSWLNGLLRGESLLVVPDTHVLLGDIGRFFKTGRRTVLVSAANSGALRLFCAQHVHDEVYRHSEEWAPKYRATRSEYLDLLAREYLPLMRTIDGGDLPADLLAPSERARIDALGESKDVPSVTLALALGAFYLTKDRAARRAAYVVDATPEDLDKWLDTIIDGGQADELEKMIVAALTVPGVAIGGAAWLAGSLAKTSPFVYLPLAGAAAYLLSRISAETYKKVGRGLGEFGHFLSEIYRPYAEALERFRAMAPPIPTWVELAETNDRKLVLARACLHRLARTPRSLMTAAELSREPWDVPVGHDAQLVRETLRAFGCFVEPSRGHWQVGHVVELT